jgi:hypothetical protein
MIKLSDTIEIGADPKALFNWFAHLPEHYLAWHPDHVLCRFEGTEGLRPGARLYAEEYLHGRLHKLRFTITRLSPPARVDYRIAPGLRGAFIATPSPGGTQFTAELEFGFTWPILGPLTDRLLKRFFPAALVAIRQHMVEEGVNLKRILETP